MFTRILFAVIIFFQGFNSVAQKQSVQAYIELYKEIAMQEMRDFGVPASITLAQGLLESGSGNSRLAVEGNNHFGIKCKKEWTGCTIKEDDDDLQECFRCYPSANDSYKDHSRFLKENVRYSKLFTLSKDDYRSWSQGLRDCGYATNPRYPQLLIGTIERNRLGRFDSIVLQGYDPFNEIPTVKEVVAMTIVNNNIPITVAKAGQQVPDIAKENQMGEWQIYKYNDLKKGAIINPGDVLYLKPKKRKASVAEHVVKPGETMWIISQEYGIKIKHLYKKNKMESGTQAKAGETLHLQHKGEMPDTGIVKITKIIPAVVVNEIEKATEIPVVAEGPVKHVVKQGETLYGISRQYSISVETIKEANNLVSDNIYMGMVLLIGAGNVKAQIPVEVQEPLAVWHIVESGETLYGIAKLHHVNVNDITSINNLSGTNLTVGQKLRIK
ncbi:MAG: LysM peptidoglycan-binding domain-containing protein [Bacteroidia bacterium]|nr:LysM peptidoglycan-binding domain-containing protein [Bacteroidia bacterium]